MMLRFGLKKESHFPIMGTESEGDIAEGGLRWETYPGSLEKGEKEGGFSKTGG